MRELQLLNSDEVAIVDAEYYDYLNQWNWGVHNGYVSRTSQEDTIYLHREVLRLAGHVDFGVGDHRNRLPLDNQKRNLRPATYSQNAQNQGIRSTNTTGLIGVSPHQGKLIACVSLNGETTHLGVFDVGDSKAGKASDVGRIYFHDADFVVLNFKRSDYPSGHPDTWPPGPYLDVIRKCQGWQVCNSVSGYWNIRWHKKCWHVGADLNGKRAHLGCFSDSPGESPARHTALLDAVKVADIAAIHLGRDKINLGREHYPPGPPRDWPEESIPDCPALRRLIW